MTQPIADSLTLLEVRWFLYFFFFKEEWMDKLHSMVNRASIGSLVQSKSTGFTITLFLGR
jgi:hypothetical protein